MPETQKKRVEQTGKNKWIFPFSEQDWAATPEAVRKFLVSLVSSQAALEKRIEELEKKLNKNSSNSSKPPSSDNPYKEKPKKNKKIRKKKKLRKGYQQKMREPTEVKNLKPEACICGNTKFDTMSAYFKEQTPDLAWISQG
jgi:transposase